MPQPNEKRRAALHEKRLARVLEFSLSPMQSLRARLNECATGEVGVFEPPAEFNSAECNVLLTHLERLEARYNILWRLSMGTDPGRAIIEQVERAMNEKGTFDPDSVGNWGRA